MNGVQAHADTEPERSLRRIIRRFQGAVQGIEAVSVVSGDGIPQAWVLGEETDADRFGAMCASLLALAGQAADEVARGDLRQVLVEGSEGSMLLVDAGSDTVLAVAADHSVNLGRVFHEARKVAGQVAEVVDRHG